ncbi:hypothetical protein HJC23_005091 [Cyclotella cryptica]|uniref:Uncharacterized protein n=1 Tax=Cyclotella cryptica TaxID=29204 RepID=A0ABD3NJJ5_9STRA
MKQCDFAKLWRRGVELCKSNKDQQQQQISMELPLYPQDTFSISFEANDSCLPDGACSHNHVPINDNTQVVAISRYSENVTYSEECIQVGEEMNVPVIDLWNGMKIPIDKDGQGSVDDLTKHGDTWKHEYVMNCT